MNKVNPFATNDVKNKIKAYYKDKYGVNHNSQVAEIKQKMLISKKKTAYNKIIEKYKNQYKPNFTLDEYNGTNKNYSWICCKCGNIFESKYSNGKIISRCFKCYPRKRVINSNIEKEIVNFFFYYYPNLIENDRELIKPLELDIVIPELKLAIEFDGDFWHSEKYKNKNYHLNKTNLCENKGYRLIHIFEHEWLFKQNIIKSKLLSIFDKNQESIYARKCTVKEITVKEKNEFLNKTHIQGEDRANIKLGLFHQNELIACMTFCKSRFNKNFEWELSRFSSSKHVIGGAGKLLKYFERVYKPKNLITYADRRYSQGNLYFKLGFTFDHFSSPNYFYCDQNLKIYSRVQCQKHKLNKILGDKFNKDLTESENMSLNGYNKIYDCGNYVFIKQY